MSFVAELCDCLNRAGLDGTVYGQYICGTLDTLEDSPLNEVEEELLQILQGSAEGDCQDLSKEIMKHWAEERERNKVSKVPETAAPEAGQQKDHTHHLASTTDAKPVSSETTVLSAEEKQRLIAQYDCESDEEFSVLQEMEDSKEGAFCMNGNVTMVTDAQRQHRDKLKAEHEVKLERQRLDRDNQKQKAQDRKEKEKKRTQKHERRR